MFKPDAEMLGKCIDRRLLLVFVIIAVSSVLLHLVAVRAVYIALFLFSRLRFCSSSVRAMEELQLFLTKRVAKSDVKTYFYHRFCIVSFAEC